MLIHSPKDLALYINSQRKQRKLSQATLSALTGLKQKTISAFENKPESTKLETLFLILSVVNLDMRVSPKDKSVDKSKWKEEW